jgi:hypothetical protein
MLSKSESIIVPSPLLDGVVEGMHEPLALKEVVTLAAEEERSAALEVAVLLPMGIEVEGSPQGDAPAADQHDYRRVHRQINPCKFKTLVRNQLN